MNWSKAKNILILAFIITNILLVYVITENKHKENDPVTNEQFIENVKDLLNENNIKLATDIPKNLPSMYLLNIEYENFEPDKLAIKFLENDKYNRKSTIYYENDKEVISVLYENDLERLEILNKNYIKYENHRSNKKYRDLGKEQLDLIVSNFLKEKGLYKDDYKLTYHNVINGEHTLRYTKVYNDFFVEVSHMEFKINSSGVKEFQRKWPVVGELNDAEIKIRPAPYALLRLLSKSDIYGKTITDISICYYFNPDMHSIGNIKNAKKGQAGPAWRIQFNDSKGTVKFLEEY
ncbi:MAG: hypothetical protein FH751_08740 [Firmicutes bacterium]|nr:hypothetical protein [Bacillota bacterium]